MKVIPLEAEGLAPLSANGIRIKVPDVIPEPGGGCRRSLCKRLRQQHLGDGIRSLLELHSIVETAKKHNKTPFNAIQALFEA